jgi:hypothetical protein
LKIPFLTTKGISFYNLLDQLDTLIHVSWDVNEALSPSESFEIGYAIGLFSTKVAALDFHSYNPMNEDIHTGMRIGETIYFTTLGINE